MQSAPLRSIRQAAHRLARTPTVAISAILCLGFGVGVTAAISSAIDRALLQPLPFRAPNRLVTVYRTTPQFTAGPFAPSTYAGFAAATRQLDALAAVTQASMLLTMPDAATQLKALRVTGNLHSMLGAPALHGRLLTAADDAADQNRVVVVSEDLWRQRFGADPALVGRTLTLDGNSYTVVGIAPRELRIPHGFSVLSAQLWVPMRFSPAELSPQNGNYLMLMGRLATGATPATAKDELRRIFEEVIVPASPIRRGESVDVLGLPAEGARTVRTPLLLMFGAACAVMLIAATNVASLLLARSVERRRELAIRSALGGSRWALMSSVIAESLLLAGAGAVLGLALAWAGVRSIGALATRYLPQLAGLSVDLRVVAFALAIAFVVSVLCAAVPAWRGASVDPQEALSGGRGGGSGRAHHRALSGLVMMQVALSLVLLVGAGLVLKGFAKLIDNDPGFNPAPLLTFNALISPANYPDGSSVQRFLEPALAAVRQQPGVVSVAAISAMPYDNWGINGNIRYEGQPDKAVTERPLVENRVATPEFFKVTGQRIIGGRLLQDSDDRRPESPNVVVVNEALAKRDFRGQDAVGKRFYIGTNPDVFATIVGVVSDIRNFGPIAPPRPEMYWTYRQGASGSPASFPIVVRVSGGDPVAIAGSVRAAIRSVDPGAAVDGMAAMPELMAKSVGRPRFYLALLGTFAVVALVLAVAGLYGVMSYAVAQRTRELGIRSALGSSAGQTVQLVARQGMMLVVAGIAIGLVGSVATTRLLQGMLYGVSPLDVTTWGLATATLIGAGAAASLLPAWRAARVVPLVAMRAE